MAKKKKKDSTLEFLENHKYVKWILFLAALIGAIFIILKVPVGIYNYLSEVIGNSHVEQSKIDRLKTGISLEYILSVFGEPTYKRSCEPGHDEASKYYECQLSDISTYRYTFENEQYYLQVLTNEKDIVLSYTISLKDPSFNPEIGLFLGRFVGDKTIKLGKSTISELEEIDDGFISEIEEPVLGNNFAGYMKLIQSDDYAVNYFIILETSASAPWSQLYTQFECDYGLLGTYEYIDGEYSDLGEAEIKKNIKKFTTTCPIQTISIFDASLFDTGSQSEKYWNLEEGQREAYLKEQLKFFRVP